MISLRVLKVKIMTNPTIIKLDLQLFGGRGGIGGSGALKTAPENGGVGSIKLPMEIKYGLQDDRVNGPVRRAAEAFEREHKYEERKAALGLDSNGNKVSVPTDSKKWTSETLNGASVVTVNGYAADGRIGGTFTGNELDAFTRTDTLKSMRRATKEGTYSISRGESFDKDGFSEFVRTTRAKAQRAYEQAIQNNVDASVAANRRSMLLHNAYLSNQSKYGYEYTLERTHSKRQYNKKK